MEETTRKIVKEYLSKAGEEIRRVADAGEGKKIMGETINRPEDLEISIDRVGEEVLENILKKHQIEATVFSEPENRDIENGNHIYGAIDPFDGSMLFLRDIPHNWYTVLSFFGKDRKPLVTGIGDILNNRYYITEEDGNYLVSGDQKKKIFPSKKKSLKDSVVLASYIMSSEYSPKFLDFFGDLVKNLHPKALFYPHGGSYIYAYLAAGLVDAYIMFEEPRSEIDPGFFMAKRAGCEIVSVNSDGSFKEYDFIPGRQHDKVELLIAASNSEIRDELINYYVKQYKKKFFLGS